MTVERRTSVVAPAVKSASTLSAPTGPTSAVLKLSGSTLAIPNMDQYIWAPMVIEYNIGGVFTVSSMWGTANPTEGYGIVGISAPGSYYFHMSVSAKQAAGGSVNGISVWALATPPNFLMGNVLSQPALVLLGQRMVSIDCGMYFTLPAAGTLSFMIFTSPYGGGVEMAVSCFMVAPA